jgi:hypothetical protein
MNFVKHPLPADFLAQYLKLTRGQLVEHYRVSQSTVNRWSATMPDDAKAAHSLVVKAARYGEGVNTFKRPRPMPVDFVASYRVMSKAALVRHYTAGMATVIKWCGTMTEADTLVHKAHVAEVLVRSQRAAIASARANRAANPKPPKDKPVKVSRRQAPGRGVSWGTAKAVPTPTGRYDVAALAARHLQRAGYIPVYCASVVAGMAAADLWRVGHKTLPTSEMMELAEKKGFAA